MSKAEKAFILVVDDKPENLKVLMAHLAEMDFNISVALHGEEAIELAREYEPDIILLDVMMPGIDGFETCSRLKKYENTKEIPVIFMTALTETFNKLRGFQVGGVDYITKPFQHEELLARVNSHLTIRHQQRALAQKNAELVKSIEQLRQEINRRKLAENELQIADTKLSALSQQDLERLGIPGIIGESQKLARIMEDIHFLQDFEKTSVLILGESGTGKELVARAIHFNSARAKKSFLPVNCSAIPNELVESAFFGHVRGAFTGAVSQRQGYFELAENGTLFLDEVGELSLPLQAKLLRTLEDGYITPVGGREQKQVNVRIIAATNVDIHANIATGNFRRDLYFRLARFTIKMPALRERQEDIALLVNHFLTKFATEMGRDKAIITSDALSALEIYHFPGNIRELKNIIEHAIISSHGTPIQPQHLNFIETSLIAPSSLEYSNSNAVEFSMSEHNSSHFLIDEEEKILEYVRQYGKINNTICRKVISSNYHHASYILKKMNSDGLLVRKGERRGSYYQLPE